MVEGNIKGCLYASIYIVMYTIRVTNLKLIINIINIIYISLFTPYMLLVLNDAVGRGCLSFGFGVKTQNNNYKLTVV